jgi:hypothetical protein
MTDGTGSRWGFLGGVGGCVLGGLTWVVVAGVVLHDWLVVGSAVVLGAALTWGALAAAKRFPTRLLGLLGASALAIVLIDSVYLVLLLPRLAAMPNYPTFISPAQLQAIRPLLFLVSLGATAAVLVELLRRRTP